ncbi:hypothetical protein ILUMI_15825 [Ignelater luminosus]|uniref:Uncharacterized protein n=1 Tax=Ignelater luminosus TaxID=2038154 RepID=A0A8K0CMV9_IGNLU|nr:hypothetical protein ILUMI_15825 [Ignelater luminosus]
MYSVLLATVGPELVSVLQDLCSPVDVDEKTYQELTDILVNHFKPARLIIDGRFKFNTIVQQEKSISEFVVALKHLAKTCNFGTFLKDVLRDRLVCGIKNSHIQQRLLAAESDFDETLKKALMLEEASKNANLFSASEPTLVNKQAKMHLNRTIIIRIRIKPFNVQYILKWDIASRSMCPKNPKKNNNESDIYMVTEGVQELSRYNVHQVSLNQVNSPIQLTVSVNRKEALFDLDTGCGFTLLSEEVHEACVKTSSWIKTSL